MLDSSPVQGHTTIWWAQVCIHSMVLSSRHESSDMVSLPRLYKILVGGRQSLGPAYCPWCNLRWERLIWTPPWLQEAHCQTECCTICRDTLWTTACQRATLSIHGWCTAKNSPFPLGPGRGRSTQAWLSEDFAGTYSPVVLHENSHVRALESLQIAIFAKTEGKAIAHEWCKSHKNIPTAIS